MAIVAKILLFAGSIRTGAYSGRTADAAQKELALQGADVTRISLADYPLPLMDQDLEREKGIPENAFKLARLIVAHDAVLICTPEYNGSMPPLVKNTIDWVSRVHKDGGKPLSPYPGKVAAICSSSERPFRRHPQRQSSARRAVAYRHGGDFAAGLGAQWRQGLRRQRQFHGGAAAARGWPGCAGR